MDYRVDLDPTHRVIRLTITAKIVTWGLAEGVYFRLVRLGHHGGPYAAIYDLSAVTGTTLSLGVIRHFARRAPSIRMGRPHVVVGTDPNIYELARIFQMCHEYRLKERFEVVQTLQEAYDLVGDRPEDFTVCLYPKELAA